MVCYNRGGQVDFLSSGQTGYVVALNERESFIQAVAGLQDRDYRSRLGKENLTRVEQFFIDTCAARYEALFTETIERASARTSMVRAASPN